MPPAVEPVWPRKTSTIVSAIAGPTVRAPNARMLASLCWRVSFALYGSEQCAQRTPRTLFAAMEMPIPVPQMRIPRSQSPETTALATFSA